MRRRLSSRTGGVGGVIMMRERKFDQLVLRVSEVQQSRRLVATLRPNCGPSENSFPAAATRPKRETRISRHRRINLRPTTRFCLLLCCALAVCRWTDFDHGTLHSMPSVRTQGFPAISTFNHFSNECILPISALAGSGLLMLCPRPEDPQQVPDRLAIDFERETERYRRELSLHPLWQHAPSGRDR